MTVNELIKLLTTYPPDLPIMVDGYEEGVDDLEPHLVLTRDVRMNVNTAWCFGRHEEAFEGDKHENAPITHAIIFRRPWHDDEA